MVQTIFLIVAVLLSFLLYKAILLLIKVVYKTTRKNVQQKTGIQKWQKLIAFVIAAGLLAVQVYSLLFMQPANTYNRAIIEKENNAYLITLIAKREQVSNDPIATLQKNIYEDSIKLEVPKAEGVINGTDILNRSAHFKYIKGSISISEKSLRMDLYYTDAYYKIATRSSWNGLYELQWRK